MIVLRVENGEGVGPYQATPRNFTATELKSFLPWAGLRPCPTTLEPDLYVNSRENIPLPHHYVDVLHRHWSPDEVIRCLVAGTEEVLVGPGDWRTGVKDEQQLFHWFTPGALRFLNSRGYRVGVYHVPSDAVWAGDYQVLFDRNRARETYVIELAGPAEASPATQPKVEDNRCVCDSLLNYAGRQWRCQNCPDAVVDPSFWPGFSVPVLDRELFA